MGPYILHSIDICESFVTNPNYLRTSMSSQKIMPAHRQVVLL